MLRNGTVLARHLQPEQSHLHDQKKNKQDKIASAKSQGLKQSNSVSMYQHYICLHLGMTRDECPGPQNITSWCLPASQTNGTPILW
eukprot:4738424-Amphidinium_carterae.1